MSTSYASEFASAADDDDDEDDGDESDQSIDSSFMALSSFCARSCVL
jgi:hypothetical protein